MFFLGFLKNNENCFFWKGELAVTTVNDGAIFQGPGMFHTRFPILIGYLKALLEEQAFCKARLLLKACLTAVGEQQVHTTGPDLTPALALCRGGV